MSAARQELAELLHWRWDPIGVSQWFPSARDEYAGYANRLAAMVELGAGADEIEAYLREVEEDQIQVGVSDERRAEVAEAILRWHAERTGALWPGAPGRASSPG